MASSAENVSIWWRQHVKLIKECMYIGCNRAMHLWQSIWYEFLGELFNFNVAWWLHISHMASHISVKTDSSNGLEPITKTQLFNMDYSPISRFVNKKCPRWLVAMIISKPSSVLVNSISQSENQCLIILSWRHMTTGISIVCSKACSDSHKRKHQSAALQVLCGENPPVIGGWNVMYSRSYSISVLYE